MLEHKLYVNFLNVELSQLKEKRFVLFLPQNEIFILRLKSQDSLTFLDLLLHGIELRVVGDQSEIFFRRGQKEQLVLEEGYLAYFF